MRVYIGKRSLLFIGLLCLLISVQTYSAFAVTPQVSAGGTHTIGLKADGTVIAAGDNMEGQCNVSVWTGITLVAARGHQTGGLKSVGTVVTVGDNFYGQCNVSGWTGIIQDSSYKTDQKTSMKN